MCCFLTAYSPAVTCWADHVLSAIPSFFGLPHPGGHMLGWPCPVSHTVLFGLPHPGGHMLGWPCPASHTVPFWPAASRRPHAGLAMSCQPYRPFLARRIPAATCWAGHVLSAIPSLFGLPHPGGHMLGWPCPASHTVPFWPAASRRPHAGLAMSCQPYRPCWPPCSGGQLFFFRGFCRHADLPGLFFAKKKI